MKKLLVALLLSLVLNVCICGCDKEEQVNKNIEPLTSIAITPQTSQSNETREFGDEDSPLFRTIGLNEDNTFKVSDYYWKLYQSKQMDNPPVEDRTYQVNGAKGKSDVHYPYFKDEDGKYDVLNSIILSRIVDEYNYNSMEEEVDRKIEYNIKFVSDNYVSILFTGNLTVQEACRSYGISYTVNFDLNRNTPISISEILDIRNNGDKVKSVLLEKIHYAMRKQLEKELTDSFEELYAEDVENQLYQTDKSYYLEDNKIYLKFTSYKWNNYDVFVYFDVVN